MIGQVTEGRPYRFKMPQLIIKILPLLPEWSNELDAPSWKQQ